jgi:nucleotide-binding universal stress UspA family protein
VRILIATEGAAHSDLAVRLGADISRATNGQPTILTVIEHEGERDQAETVLTRAESMMRPLASDVQRCIRIGRASREIACQVQEGRHDLLIVGEHPKHRLARRLMGPTAQSLIAMLPCPVLIVRNRNRTPRRVLVCEAGRKPSLLSRLILRLAPLIEVAGELTVLHVMSQMAAWPEAQDWELAAEAEELMEKRTPEGRMLAQDLKLLKPLSIRLQAKVRHGLVVEEILSEAKSGDYDLVVIGAHQSKGWERYLLDDLARQIIQHADRPVLVV